MSEAKAARKKLDFYFLSFIFIFLGVIYRFPTIQKDSDFLNPDEAEMLAMANSVNFPLFGDTYNTSTYGPLLPYSLRLLHLLGWPNTFGGLHLLQILVTCLTFLIIMKIGVDILQHQNQKRVFFCFQSTLLLSLIAAESTDFLSLCSETLPILFTSLIFALSASSKKSLNFIGGCLLGFVLFTKLQVFPLALFLLLFTRLMLQFKINSAEIKSLKFKDIIPSIFGFLTATSIFLFSLWMSGSLEKWIQNSLFFSLKYSTTDLGNDLGGAKSLQSKLLGALNLIGSDVFLSTSIIVGAIFLIWVLMKPEFKSMLLEFSPKDRFDLTRIAILHVAMWIISILSIAFSGNLFPHYLLIIYLTFSLSTLLFVYQTDVIHSELIKRNSIKKGKNSKRKLHIQKRSLRFSRNILASILVILLAFNFSVERNSSFSETFKVAHNSKISPETKILAKKVTDICPSGSTVMIWGWGSEFFAYANWKPTPNFINDATRLIAKGSDVYTLNTLISLLDQEIPDCILSANGDFFKSDLFRARNSLQDFNLTVRSRLIESYGLIFSDQQLGTLWTKRSQ